MIPEWLNALLEWRVFAPLSKVTWIALVVAEPIILYFFSSLNKPAYATHWSTVSLGETRDFRLNYLWTFRGETRRLMCDWHERKGRGLFYSCDASADGFF